MPDPFPVSLALEDVPDVALVPWRPLRDVSNPPDTGLRDLLRRAGAYVIGFGPEGVEPDLRRDDIEYVGETHGKSRSLGARLASFGRSVGLVPGPGFGHIAGDRLRDVLPDAEPAELLVAFDPGDLAVYVDDGIEDDNAGEAISWLRRAMRGAYEVQSREFIDRYDPWLGVECKMARGWYAYLGSSTPPSTHLDFEVWKARVPEPRFEASIATVEDARHVAWAFYSWWNYGVNPLP